MKIGIEGKGHSSFDKILALKKHIGSTLRTHVKKAECDSTLFVYYKCCMCTH